MDVDEQLVKTCSPLALWKLPGTQLRLEELVGIKGPSGEPAAGGK